MIERIASFDIKHSLAQSALHPTRAMFKKCYSHSCLSLRDPTEFIIEVKKLQILLSTEMSSVIQDLCLLQMRNIGSKLGLMSKIMSEIIQECSSKCGYFFQELSLEQGRRRSINKQRLCSHCRKGLLIAELQKSNVPIIHGIISQQQRNLDESFSSVQENLELTNHQLSDSKRIALSLEPSQAVRKLTEVLNLVIDQTQNFDIDQKQMVRIGQYQQRFQQIKTKVKTNIAHTLQKTFITIRKKKQTKKTFNSQNVVNKQVQTTNWQFEDEIKSLQIKKQALSKTLNWERTLKDDIRTQLKECVKNLQNARSMIQSLEIKVTSAQQDIKSKKQIILLNQKQIDDLHKKLQIKSEEKLKADSKIQYLKAQIFSCQNKIVKLNEKILGKIIETTTEAGVQTNSINLNKIGQKQYDITLKEISTIKEQSKISSFKGLNRVTSFNKSPKTTKKQQITNSVSQIVQKVSKINPLTNLQRDFNKSAIIVEHLQSKTINKPKTLDTKKSILRFNDVNKKNITYEQKINSKSSLYQRHSTGQKDEIKSVMIELPQKQQTNRDIKLRSSRQIQGRDSTKSKQNKDERLQSLNKRLQSGSGASFSIPIVAPIHSIPSNQCFVEQKRSDVSYLIQNNLSMQRQRIHKNNKDNINFRINRINKSKIDNQNTDQAQNSNTLTILSELQKKKCTIMNQKQNTKCGIKRSKKYSNSMQQNSSIYPQIQYYNFLPEKISKQTETLPYFSNKNSLIQKIQKKSITAIGGDQRKNNKLKLNIKSLSKYSRKSTNDWFLELRQYLSLFPSPSKESINPLLSSAIKLYQKTKPLQKYCSDKFNCLKSQLFQTYYNYQKSDKSSMLLLCIIQMLSYHKCSEQNCQHIIQLQHFLENSEHKLVR